MYCVFLSLLFLLLSTINRLISISSTRSNPPSSCTEDIWTLSSALESTPVCTDRNTRVHTYSPSAFLSHPDISRTWAFSSVAVLSAELYSAARFAELSSVLLVAAFRFHHRSHHYSKNDSNHRRRRRKSRSRRRSRGGDKAHRVCSSLSLSLSLSLSILTRSFVLFCFLLFFKNPKHSFFWGFLFLGGTKLLTTETDFPCSLFFEEEL